MLSKIAALKYRDWLQKNFYLDDKDCFVNTGTDVIILNLKNGDYVNFSFIRNNEFYVYWYNKNFLLHREDGPAMEFWSKNQENDKFELRYLKYALKNEFIDSNLNDIHSSQNNEFVELDREKISSLFWKVKCLTSAEIKDEYLFNPPEKLLIETKLFGLSVDSK